MKQKLIFNGETLEVNGTLLSHYGIEDGSCLQVVIQVGWIIRVSDLHNPGRVVEVFLKGHNPEVSLNIYKSLILCMYNLQAVLQYICMQPNYHLFLSHTHY